MTAGMPASCSVSSGLISVRRSALAYCSRSVDLRADVEIQGLI